MSQHFTTTDKNGNQLAVGDTVAIRGIVAAIVPGFTKDVTVNVKTITIDGEDYARLMTNHAVLEKVTPAATVRATGTAPGTAATNETQAAPEPAMA